MKRSLLFVSLLLLAACAPKNKVNPLEKDSKAQLCPSAYNPILVERTDLASVDPNTLPNGSYVAVANEWFLEEEGRSETLYFHFKEEILGSSATMTQVCGSEIIASDSFNYLFSTVSRYLKAATPGVVVRSYRVKANSGSLVREDSLNSITGPTALVDALAQFANYRVYRISANQYEIRSSHREVLGDKVVKKKALVRLRYAP